VLIEFGNISLEVDRGEILAFIGESGTLKSTLIIVPSGVNQSDPGSEFAGCESYE